ncbi:MAG TPA: sugar porter family MFS transporter [Candidatus Sulfopaludibacter sp.]|nr:sugar porter family MFS transporter [Candidatus Sulfopaludibacter sp.]
MKQTKLFTVSVALVVALGGFVWGFDATVISGAVPFIQRYFALTGDRGDFLLGLAVSCLGWGVLGGTAVSGFFSDRFGRKKVLITTAVFFIVSALLSALTTHFAIFVGARILGGIAVGGAILIAPVYIAEISPPQLRGSMVSLNQLMIVLGISASFFSNYFLLNTGENNWRWMLGMDAVPAALFFLFLFAVPESPRWLFGQGREQHAREILSQVRDAENLDEELNNIRLSFQEKKTRFGIKALFSRRMSFVMGIALVIAFFQQITGINAVFYYLPTIFAQAGGGTNAAFWQAALVGVVNLAMTFVAILFVDRLGRKPLLAIGATGMAISLLTCSWAFHASHYQLTDKSFAILQQDKVPADLINNLKSADQPVFATEKEFLAALDARLGADRLAPYHDTLATAGLNIRASLVLYAIIGFVASFAISLGPVMWVMLSEIFPNAHRGAGMSVAGFWNATVSASVTFIFPWELSHLQASGTFLAYGLLALAALLFVLLAVPETKGKSLEELERLLVRLEPKGDQL